MVKNDEEIIINQTNLPEIGKEINNENSQRSGPKLFSKNPNKINDLNNQEEDEDDLEKDESENKEFFNQNESEDEGDLKEDDSNININRSVEKTREIQNFNVEIY